MAFRPDLFIVYLYAMSSTSQQIGSALKTFAKVGTAVVLQIFLFTAVGIFLNIIFNLFLIHEYRLLFADKSYIIFTIVLVLFLLLLPLTYFFIGKKQGIKAGVSKVIHEKGDTMVGFIVAKFTDKMANNPDWQANVEKNGIAKTVKNIFPGFIRTLNGLPWILKIPLGKVFDAVDFAGAVEEAYKTRPDAPINSPETNQHITQIVATKLKQKFQPPTGKLLLFVVGINLVLFIVAKVLF